MMNGSAYGSKLGASAPKLPASDKESSHIGEIVFCEGHVIIWIDGLPCGIGVSAREILVAWVIISRYRLPMPDICSSTSYRSA